MTHAVNKLATDFMRETGHQVSITFSLTSDL
jgi:hypothetical protein